jgi:hypothetical protein
MLLKTCSTSYRWVTLSLVDDAPQLERRIASILRRSVERRTLWARPAAFATVLLCLPLSLVQAQEKPKQSAPGQVFTFARKHKRTDGVSIFAPGFQFVHSDGSISNATEYIADSTKRFSRIVQWDKDKLSLSPESAAAKRRPSRLTVNIQMSFLHLLDHKGLQKERVQLTYRDTWVTKDGNDWRLQKREEQGVVRNRVAL